MKHSESIAARRTEKIESYLEVLYMLLGDVVRLAHGSPGVLHVEVRNR